MKHAIFVLMGMALLSARLCAGDIEVRGCAAYPPYSYAVQQTGKSVPSGLDTEIVQAVFTRMQRGFQIQLQERRLLWKTSGELPCSYQWPDYADVKGIRVGPLRNHSMVLATRQGGPLTSWGKLDDLKPYTIGVIAGYVYDNYAYKRSRGCFLETHGAFHPGRRGELRL